MADIGRLKRVPLREVWPHEAHDFTRWLEQNIDVLNDVTGLNLSSAEREQAAGSFSVDLVAEDESGDTVIIENQLERSDHDHLGKLITYASALNASAAVWIVSEPRPEHVQAVTWLNESTPSAFFLLQVEAVRIGDSLPAPILNRIVGPSEEGRQIGEIKKERNEREQRRRHFWESLLERARERTSLHASISPSTTTSVRAATGLPGTTLEYWIRQQDAGVMLAIGRRSADENKQIYDFLFENRDDIDGAFGPHLRWIRHDQGRGCWISTTVDDRGYRADESEWPEIQSKMIDAMIRLDQSLRPHLDQLGNSP